MHLRGETGPIMQAIISAALVKSLRPAAKPFEVRDTRVKGFLLRVQPSGSMTYYAEYGRGKRIAIGRSDVIAPDRARDRARDILASAQFGEDPMEERRLAKAHTLGSFIDEVYEPWAEANLRTSAKHDRPAHVPASPNTSTRSSAI